MSGKLDCLSCGDGHTELKFDKSDPIETDRARRAVETLMRSGCILFIEKDGKLTRIEGFDPETDTYIIADVPETSHIHAENETQEQTETETTGGKKKPAKKTSKKSGTKRVDAKSVDATAVPIRSGG